jgi:hypothetical protein
LQISDALFRRPTGGSWLTALTSNLGAGKFDDAWLVQNFERRTASNHLFEQRLGLGEARCIETV